MPRRCTICDHRDREAIDRALVGGKSSFRAIAEEFEGLSAASLHRHRQGHIAPLVASARAADDDARGATLLDEVRALHARTLRILAAAEGDGDATTALRALREARAGLELLAKLLGEIDSAPVVSVAVGSDWASLRSAILGALEPFPDARLAVADALGGEGRVT